MHEHAHHHHGGNHLKPLVWGLVITLAFAVVEAIGGWVSGSLALLGDAGHMITDSFSLALGAVAALLAQKPASREMSFGWGRAEVLAAIVNAVLMLLIVVGIAIAAFDRLREPQPVQGGMVMVIASIGLLVNISVAWVLHRGEQTLNIRGALLHVMGDLLGSVAALVAGAVIYFTGWTPIDPLLSVLICVLILFSSLKLLRDAVDVLMERVPRELSLPVVGEALAAVEGVRSVHDLHIWRLDSRMISLSAHIVVDDLSAWPKVLDRLRKALIQRFDIHHITLQPEPLHIDSTPIIDRVSGPHN
ncbi:cation diffusion facilitator family transporter [Microbulbifer hydrolyticus]|uniref:Cation diffusion facilitator family transporter n=1 Tax=Microbulbifer hydrolyticus TaxID=48074 RepID=A0A6P1T9Y2_9GAMM|nr:cation diffusion facilitator family transporter [Microbulbifer hydrolyticus]MBB5212786.1 cobalt-zinc-cadmium efflux system protein [Microbulbifer hydrolyticus]QHQ38416.1 cation diffusion facilitator family transporter [Microbulbifer hydrolyticus]